MSVSRRIFELWEAIQSSEPSIDVFRSDHASKLQELAEYARVWEDLETKTDNPHLAILLALRSLAVQQHDLADRLSETELVLTLPRTASTVARPTLFVIREMIEAARNEIIVAGYRITNEEILAMLHQAVLRQVRIIVLCGRADNDAERMLATWPRNAPRPQIFQDVEIRESPTSLMHIKALLVDSSHLLISSANFTYSGMARNLEFGMHTTGPAAVEARTVLTQLMKSRLCEPIAWNGSGNAPA